MELFPNYYFTGSLISSYFAAFVAFFLFRIHNRTRATFHLALVMLYMAGYNLAYTTSASVYGFPTPLLRWLNLLLALLGATHAVLFFFHFPTTLPNRWRKLTGGVLYGVAVVLSTLTLINFYRVPLRYSFSAHYWESSGAAYFRVFSFFILFYFSLLLIGGIIRSIRGRGAARHGAILMTISFAVVTVIPGILNTMSRVGTVDRGTFQTATVLFNLAGFFGTIVTYISYTRDRTTFMGKIVAICLVTILLVLQINGYFWFDAQETYYDRAKLEQIGKLKNGGSAPPDLRYQTGWSAADNKLTTPLDGEARQQQAEFYNTWLYNRIEKDGELDNKLAAAAPKTARGYIYRLQLLLEEDSPDRALEAINNEQKRVSFFNEQLMHIRPGQSEQLTALAAKIEDRLPGFGRAVTELLSDDSLDDEMKLKAARLVLSAMQPPGSRHYRGRLEIGIDESVPRHYVAYMVDDGQGGLLETGFDYVHYRRQMAKSGFIQFWIITGACLFVLIGFRIFFALTLVRPLNEVIAGVADVDRGNLERQVPVRIEDEIGFLAGAFNRMVQSVREAQNKLQDYADQLEDKVRERTRELKESLDEIKTLKTIQDGDYFLTTLLLQPLGVNHAEGNYHSIEFLVKQKKKFDFRQWSRDIGGDINISHTINLYGRRYLVFLNADAMGKSIQGAGGALVLGSVLLSIIERTTMIRRMARVYPERWLKNAFLELHRVFESFDGSMLVSTFMGLIDDENGMMYFINAEHPNAVLYRDKKAAFLDDEIFFRKLGTAGLNNRIRIETFQIEPGDVVIIGSDGRDDIAVGIDKNGERMINENEHKFLEFVEQSDADLIEIEERLNQFGELIDDLSLLKITRIESKKRQVFNREEKTRLEELSKAYKQHLKEQNLEEAQKKVKEALKTAPRYPALVKAQSQLYYRMKDYRRAFKLGSGYINEHPSDLRFLYFVAWCARKRDDHTAAINLAERLRLRDPDSTRALEFLIDMYITSKNYHRARKLWLELQEIQPENPNLSDWETVINDNYTPVESRPTVRNSHIPKQLI